jgi:type IV pilus assembly protein PilC
MPRYAYTALTADGAEVSGVLAADSKQALSAQLTGRQLQVVSAAEKKSILQLEITKRRVPRKEVMHFSRQLGAFLTAGIPILDAIEAIAAETSHRAFRSALMDMADTLRGGETFSNAAAAHPEAFPDFYLGILRSAESTGQLDEVLDQLSEYLERDLDAKRRVAAALVYPAVILVMSVVTVVVLTSFVLPKFESFFHQLHARLPLPTRILLDLSHFLTTWWFVFVGAAGAAVSAAGASLRTQRGRDARDRLILRVPVVGDLVRHAVLERFARILSSMVRAGVPLPQALVVTGQGTNNVVYREGLMTAREAMLRGEGLAQPLSDTGLFPAAARQMIKVGEDTGSLERQLDAAAAYFDRELDYKLKRFTGLFEPAVILVMGLVVGFVAIALVSAMYGIFRQARL